MGEGDCVVLYEAAIRLGARDILEFGTGLGHSTVALAMGVCARGGRVITIDCWDPLVVGDGGKAARQEVSSRGLGHLVEFLTEEATAWDPRGRSFDMVFIDTSHDLGPTRAELAKVVPLLRPGGEVFLHDVLAEIYARQGDILPINRAALEFVWANPGWNYAVLHPEPGMLGIGRLWRCPG
jgi:predicted O-methyltransferase YrrM